MQRRKSNMLFYGIAVLLLAASLAVLLNLLRRFERDLETNVEGLQRAFADENVMRTPNDERIRFAAAEELAWKYQDFGYFGRITVTKLFGTEERAIYPFYLPALLADAASSTTIQGHPIPRASRAQRPRASLVSNNRMLGHLYVTVDQSTLANVRLAIGSLAMLLIAALGMLGLQFRRQEQVISRTTVELEQKRREMVRLERLSMAGQLSANVFHDLRKPMLNIKNEMQESDLSAGEAHRRIMDQVDFFSASCAIRTWSAS
jgi:signal transduction histidine kinase